MANLEPRSEYEAHTYRSDVTGLTLALFFMVLARMQKGKVSSESYVTDCERACALANEEEVDTRLTKEHVDDWIKQISSENWAMGQDWWGSVPENVFERLGKSPTEEPVDDYDVELVRKKKRRMDSRDAEQDAEGTLLPGLGTMMQESIDWLNEDRRADYLDWRAAIEERLDRMDNGCTRTRMKAKGIAAR